MILADISVTRPIFATMVISVLLVFGLINYNQIGMDFFPEVEFPYVTILTVLPGADPETVELEVTDRIEEAVSTLEGIKTLSSASFEGFSQVMIEFVLGKDVDVGAQEVRDRVASIRGDLPSDTEPPLVEKFAFDSMPVVSVALFGEESIREITEFAKDNIKTRLQTIRGVGRVNLIGNREREVRIWLDADLLKAYGLTVSEVEQVLLTENVEIPGGRIEQGTSELVVKTLGQLESVEAFENLVLAYRKGAPVRLRDIGYAEDGQEDERSLAKWNDRRAVALECMKQSGTNTVRVAEAIKAEVAELQQELPEGLEMAVVMDNSFFVTKSIAEVKKNLAEGAFFAALVIFFFLRNLRATIIATLAIPISVIGTFSFMHYLGFTINNLTMLGLTISVGMLVDDAIVVMENIYRHMEMGKSRVQAAREGTAEIGLAVFATTLSIVAVFVPVAFMTGMVGQFFYEFGLTVAFAVLISLLISFTLTPMLCSRFLRILDWRVMRLGTLFHSVEKLIIWGTDLYRKTLGFCLRQRALTMAVATVIFIGSLLLAAQIPGEFAPQEDEGEFTVFVELPEGAALRETLRQTEMVEEEIRATGWVTDIYTTIGKGERQKQNGAELLVKLIPAEERSFNQVAAMNELRTRLNKFSGRLKTNVVEAQRLSSGGWAPQIFQYSIQGPSLEQLEQLANEYLTRMRANGNFVDIDTTFETGKPQVSVTIDRDKAADLGVSTIGIASTIGSLIGGREAGSFKESGNDYTVRIRLQQADRLNAGDIGRLEVRADDGRLVELNNVVTTTRETGPVEINRLSRRRQVMVLANVTEDLPLGEALKLVESWNAEIEVPEGYTTKVVGMAEIMVESFASMNFALLLAVLLIYMTLASQYESYIHPLTIMLSLPLSVVGAMGALYLSGLTMNIFSMIGIIMLMGLVTKNAILLVDFTNQCRREGLDRQAALMKAGPIRFRPIMMTAISTIAAAIPVAFFGGSGAETRAPMAICVIGGMLTSTFLTLVVIPVVYSLLDGFFTSKPFRWLGGKIFSAENGTAAS
jgi:HAE1 family hydrophobic/amphiphilic exporter-1